MLIIKYLHIENKIVREDSLPTFAVGDKLLITPCKRSAARGRAIPTN